MALTVLQATNSTLKSVKVRITADTVITQDGRGIPVYAGSVINVKPEDANILIACVKAERAKPEDEEKLVPNPNLPAPGAQKVGSK